MSRSQRLSSREQNGSLTSEPDSVNHTGTAHPQTNGGRTRTSRTGTKNDKGPDTSTPVKTDQENHQQDRMSRQEGVSVVHGNSVRRNLAEELDATHTSVNSSVSSSAGAVQRVNRAAQALTAAAYSPALSSIRHDSSVNYSPATSSIHPDSSMVNNSSSTFGVSPGMPRRSFVSEFENGTIQAQRHELQMLMTELKDRDRELNEMVKAHHHQLLGWEEDRQRILTLENKNAQLEADAKRKGDQVRALVARLKTMESVEQTKRAALEHAQSQLSSTTEQLSQTQLKLQETQEKSRQMGSMVKELSNTLGKLESKEQEMLSLLKAKDKDLTSASNHLTELSSKLKSIDARVKQAQKAEADALKQAAEWKDKYTECKKVTDKLKSDLNRSQMEEEESRLEVDKAKREQEKLRKQIIIMSEREKRQEQLTGSQRLKQERTDAELNSIRQLYERQQRDLTLLQLNLDSTKDLLSKQSENNKTDYGNISLLLQSPTSGRPVAYYTGENTVSLPSDIGGKSDKPADYALSIVTSPEPAVAVSDDIPRNSLSTGDLETGHLSAVGTGHHHGENPAEHMAADATSPDPADSENASGAAGVATTAMDQQQQQRLSRSGIPVRVAGTEYRWTGTPKPVGMSMQQHRGRSLERPGQGVRSVSGSQTARSESAERRTEGTYGRPTPEHLPQHQASEEQRQRGMHSAGTQLKELQVFSRQLRQDFDWQDNQKVFTTSNTSRSHTPPPVSYHNDRDHENSQFHTPPRLRTTAAATPPQTSQHLSRHTTPQHLDHQAGPQVDILGPGVMAGRGEDSVNSADYPEQTGLSVVGGEESGMASSWLLEGPADDSGLTGASGCSGVSARRENHSDRSMAESPTSKLHRLLTESRQMVQSLERSTYPPFFTQEPLSPIKHTTDED